MTNTILLHVDFGNALYDGYDDGGGDVTLRHGAGRDEGSDAAVIQVLWVITRLDLNLVAGEVMQVRDDYRFFTDNLQHQLLLWRWSRGGAVGQMRRWGQDGSESRVSHSH